MTPEQVELIRKSFDAMWPIQLRARPDAKDLFRGDMERQRIKLMGMIAALVGSLDERRCSNRQLRSQVASTPDLAFSHRNMSQWARRKQPSAAGVRATLRGTGPPRSDSATIAPRTRKFGTT
jgi:hypothetical protein